MFTWIIGGASICAGVFVAGRAVASFNRVLLLSEDLDPQIETAAGERDTTSRSLENLKRVLGQATAAELAELPDSPTVPSRRV